MRDLEESLRVRIARVVPKSPAEKAGWVRARGSATTMILGDGANDSLAFNEAACRGTPVG